MPLTHYEPSGDSLPLVWHWCPFCYFAQWPECPQFQNYKKKKKKKKKRPGSLTNIQLTGYHKGCNMLPNISKWGWLSHVWESMLKVRYSYNVLPQILNLWFYSTSKILDQFDNKTTHLFPFHSRKVQSIHSNISQNGTGIRDKTIVDFAGLYSKQNVHLIFKTIYIRKYQN